MARPIAETPTLYGKDAKRFAENMRKVEGLSKEERRRNSEELESQFQKVIKNLNLRILI